MKAIIPSFKTRKEQIKWIVEHKSELIRMKKFEMKKADGFGFAADVLKGLSTNHQDDLASGVIKRSVIGNTYNWMDSHDDVHLDGVFSKTIRENADKVWHLHDHKHEITAKVGKPTSLYEKQVSWKDLGVNKEGKTTALFMDSDIIKEYNSFIYNQYLKGEINQHSVGMVYVQIDLAVNDEEMKEEFKTWNKYVGVIGNKERAEELGFFWAVKEAKLIEISAVLAGSNELTPTVPNEEKNTTPIIPIKENYWDKLASELRA